MVEIKLVDTYLCDICKTSYQTQEEAEQCEKQGFVPNFWRGWKVKITHNLGYDEWIKTVRGGSVKFDIYSPLEYIIEDIIVSRKTHEPEYIIRQFKSNEDRKSTLEMRDRILEIWNPEDDLYQRAAKLTDEEFINNWSVRFALPERCLGLIDNMGLQNEIIKL